MPRPTRLLGKPNNKYRYLALFGTGKLLQFRDGDRDWLAEKVILASNGIRGGVARC